MDSSTHECVRVILQLATPPPSPIPATGSAAILSGTTLSVIVGVAAGVVTLLGVACYRSRGKKEPVHASRYRTGTHSPVSGAKSLQDRVGDAASKAEPAPPGTLGENGGATGPLPPGWKAAHDAVSNRTYFFNPSNGESSWARPEQSGGGSIIAKGNDRYMV